MVVGRIKLPTFFNMDLEDYARGWNKFAKGLEGELIKQMHEKKELFEEFVTEQLYSGVNGDEVPLRPTYTQDPYFMQFKNPKAEAERYKKWKAKIQPPARSYLGFRPRNIDTPNLIIRGDFYSSITAVPIADGVMIASQGLMFSADIENKYGNYCDDCGATIKDNAKYYLYNILAKEKSLL